MGLLEHLATSLNGGPVEVWAVVDRAAELALNVDEYFDALRQFYTEESGLQVPAEWL
jgi:hypothetical protein